MGSTEPTGSDELLPTAIVREIKSGRSSIVKKLIESRTLNAQERETGNTALHVAILYQQWSICSLLLKEPTVDINLRNKRQQTPLLAAVDSRYWKVVQRLLLLHPKSQSSHKIVDWTATDDRGQNALHLLCARGAKPKLLRAILATGRSGNASNSRALLRTRTTQGDLAVHCAIKNGHDALVAEIASRDPDALSQCAGDGSSCLQLAVLSGSGAVVAAVLSFAAQSLLIPKDFIWHIATTQMIQLLTEIFYLTDSFPDSSLSNTQQQEISPSDGATTASVSPSRRKLTIRTSTVRSPAKWKQISFQKQSSQRIGQKRYKLLGRTVNKNVAAQLASASRSEFNNMRPTDEGKSTSLLFWAVENRDCTLLNVILAQPETDVKLRGHGGETILHRTFSTTCFSASVCDVILQALRSQQLICDGKAGLPQRKPGKFHATKKSKFNQDNATYTSIWSVYRQVLINARNETSGATALHHVMRLVEISALSEKKALAIIKDMLDLGADPNLPDNKGATPLHLCVRDVGSPALTALLVQRGGDPHSVDEYGHSAFYFAVEREQSLLVAALGECEPAK